MVESYYPKVERISVLFWDLNNLKEINKIKGEFYYLKGGFDISKLSKFKQLTVNAYNIMYEKKQVTKEKQEVLNYFKTRITFVS